MNTLNTTLAVVDVLTALALALGITWDTHRRTPAPADHGAETWTADLFAAARLPEPVDPWAGEPSDRWARLAPTSHTARDGHPSGAILRLPPYVVAQLDVDRGRRLAAVRAQLGRLDNTAPMPTINGTNSREAA